MSTLHPHRPTPRHDRRTHLSEDLVAVLAMVAILALTALCLLGQSLAR